MKKAMKKLFAGLLALSLTFGAANAANAAGSPTSGKEAVAEDNAKVDKATKGAASKVDTNEDGTAALNAVTKTDAKAVTVNAKVVVDGVEYAVTTVSAKAFANAKKATKVTLPKTITTIEKNAFKGASSLKNINLPITKSITIEKGAFSGLDTTKMTFTVSKKMSKKERKKFEKALKAAGFKGKVKYA